MKPNIQIDDWAWRRNHRYGTIICDLARRKTIALLPDRAPPDGEGLAGKAARELTRRYHLDIADAPEELFKLCLDMGLGLSMAEAVMRSVKQVR